ncbi:Orsellinic acid/F9775 biosynthesis cluster protein D [Paramyrothecium foliicola]|nr:Orsellinic acid/F9775 biosynthesis cluster protein D [Paramyrothecium foliicola]
MVFSSAGSVSMPSRKVPWKAICYDTKSIGAKDKDCWLEFLITDFSSLNVIKRMKYHWSESHGVSAPTGTFAKPAILQTFFRGTKLRYFEVNCASISGPAELGQQQIPVVAAPVPPHSSKCNQPALDLDILRYFHHFAFTTSLTLPTGGCDSAPYWQSGFTARALEVEWLMYGLLAISLGHLARSCSDPVSKHEQTKRFLDFLGRFTSQRESLMVDAGDMEMDTTYGSRLHCLLDCCLWTSEMPPHLREDASELMLHPFNVHNMIKTFQVCSDWRTISASLQQADRRNPAYASGLNHQTRDSVRHAATIPRNRDLIRMLQALPFRMAEVFGRPNGSSEVLTVIATIKDLIDCLSLSTSSESRNSMWAAMIRWPQKLSPHFCQMLIERSPAALVVVAHWSVLIKRAEACFWFLDGLAQRFLDQVKRELPDEPLVHGLIDHSVMTYLATTEA